MEFVDTNIWERELLAAEVQVSKVFAKCFRSIAQEWDIPIDVIDQVFQGEAKGKNFVYKLHALLHLINVRNWTRSMVNYIINGSEKFKNENPDMVSDLINMKWNLDAAVLLHDIWKTDEIIWDLVNSDKKGWFSPEEIAIIKTHPQIWHDIIRKLRSIDFNTRILAATIALSHHTKFKWGGYPLEVDGKHIHVICRIVALIDVFDALGWPRPYIRDGHRLDQKDLILKIMKKGERHNWQFDPVLLDLFEKNIDQLLDEKRGTIKLVKQSLVKIDSVKEWIVESFFVRAWIWNI